MNNISLQLYSVKNNLDEDYKNTLSALSQMGYDGIEFAGSYGGYTGKELNEILQHFALTPVSAHIDINQLENNLDFHTEILGETECRTIICSFAGEDDITNYEKFADRLTAIAEKCLAKGYEFGYHNHKLEFLKDENGNYYYDLFMNKCGPIVLNELDIGWLAVCGIDPEEMIRKYAGTVTYIHLRQFKEKDGEFVNSTLDDGIVDIKKCIKIAKLMGCNHFIIEQGKSESELEDAKINIDYVKKLGL